MASAAILNFETVLAPISGENPAGVELRADASHGADYHAVRDLRSANRAAERQLLADAADGVPPDWRPVLQRGVTVLTEKAKDLEIAAYVIEALVRQHGFAGLRDGFRLTRELIERYWDHLYPVPDEDGLETRLAPLIGLNGAEGEGTLISPILCIPLTRPESVSPLACYHFQQALALAQVKDEAVRAKRLQDGSIALETVQQAVAETPRDFFAVLVQDLNECQDEFAKLNQVLDEKCGAQAPPTSNIRTALSACRDALYQVAKGKLPTEEKTNPAAATPSANGTAATTRPLTALATTENAHPSQGIMTRGDAFRVLLEVAEYFRRSEPHSIVSYSLEQVVRWGNMPLPALLNELITDDSPRQQFFRQVGIRASPNPSNND